MCLKIKFKINVSDHLPVCCIIDFSLDKVTTSANIDKQVNPRVQWAKVDTEVYTAAIEESISSIHTDFFVDNRYDLDTNVRKVNNILNEAAMQGALKRKKHRKRTYRLKGWTPDIRKQLRILKGPFMIGSKQGGQRMILIRWPLTKKTHNCSSSSGHTV